MNWLGVARGCSANQHPGMLIWTAPGAVLWPAAMIVWGPGFRSTPHRHHCVQLIMTLGGSLRIRGGRDERWRRCGAALIRPDAVHEVDASVETVLIGFVDAESELGAGLSARIAGDVATVDARTVARWRQALGSLHEDTVERWASDHLLRGRRAARLDPRVRAVLTHIRRGLAAGEDLSLEALASIAGLSPSRFMHLFTESLGVPLRPYILWLRLQRGACELMRGASVSAAAHRAGFSDAAHLTRTFRRMLGASPSEIALRNRQARGLSVEAGASSFAAATAGD
jgi:AraC-like DNA-binding protein